MLLSISFVPGDGDPGGRLHSTENSWDQSGRQRHCEQKYAFTQLSSYLVSYSYHFTLLQFAVGSLMDDYLGKFIACLILCLC